MKHGSMLWTAACAVSLAGSQVLAAQGAVDAAYPSRPSREAARRLYERAGFSVRDTNVYRYVVPAPKGGR